jgi:hypothetical protein
LKQAGEEDDHPDRHRYSARKRRVLHLDRRHSNAQWKRGRAEHGPDEEVTDAHERGQPTKSRAACVASDFAVPQQHGEQ